MSFALEKTLWSLNIQILLENNFEWLSVIVLHLLETTIGMPEVKILIDCDF